MILLIFYILGVLTSILVSLHYISKDNISEKQKQYELHWYWILSLFSWISALITILIYETYPNDD